MMKPHLEEKYLHTIVKIIVAHFSNDVPNVYLFGSRATGNIKEYSDVDLAIEFFGEDRFLSKSKLEAVFEASLLPYRVDQRMFLHIQEDNRSNKN